MNTRTVPKLKSEFDITDGMLRIKGNAIPLPYPVVQSVLAKNLIIVRLSVPAKKKFNRNIYAFTLGGELAWQIEEAPHGGDISKPFMNLWLSQDGQLIAGNWIGVDYKVYLQNGGIEAIKFTK